MADTSGVSQTGLELFLEFDGDYNDSSSNARHQTASRSEGKYRSGGVNGQYVEMDAVVFPNAHPQNNIDTGLTDIGSASLFAGAGEAWTVAVWVKNFQSGKGVAGQVIGRYNQAVELGDFRIYPPLHLRVGLGGDKLALWLRGQRSDYDFAVNDDDWHLFVLTWDGTDAKLYLDNVLQANPAVGSEPESTLAKIHIGGITRQTWDSFAKALNYSFQGGLDDLRVYSRALNAAEVTLLFVDGGGDAGDDEEGVTTEPEDLELLLAFEEDLLDSSVNERHQTANEQGTITYDVGQVGLFSGVFDGTSAAIFDGSYTGFGDATFFAGGSQEWTLSFWFNADEMSNTTTRTLCARWDSSQVNNRDFRLRINRDSGGDYSILLQARDGTEDEYASGTFTHGDWVHLAVTWDGTNLKLWKGGVDQGSATSVGAKAESAEPFRIGCENSASGPDDFFDGKMDDLRVYSRAVDGDGLENISGLEPTRFDADLTLTSLAGSVASFEVVFEDTPDDFVAGDVTPTNGAVSNVAGSGTTYTFDVTASSDGEVTVQIAEDAVLNGNGIGNKASDVVSFSVAGVSDPSSTGLLRFDRTASQTFTASAVIGPFTVSQSPLNRGVIAEARVVLGRNTDATGTVAFACGVDMVDVIERIDNDAEQFSRTSANLLVNHGTCHPRVGGNGAAIVIDVSAGHLVFEQAALAIEQGGRNVAPRYTA